MEEEELSLKLFESFLPRFFKNIFEFYYNKDKENEQNSHKVGLLNKEDINSKSEELDIRQRCLKDFQMMAAEKQVRAGKDFMTPFQTKNIYVPGIR